MEMRQPWFLRMSGGYLDNSREQFVCDQYDKEIELLRNEDDESSTV